MSEVMMSEVTVECCYWYVCKLVTATDNVHSEKCYECYVYSGGVYLELEKKHYEYLLHPVEEMGYEYQV